MYRGFETSVIQGSEVDQASDVRDKAYFEAHPQMVSITGGRSGDNQSGRQGPDP